ncbi:glycosyltransferase family 2 protein [Gallaecimonas pentaromativorans]|uniref:glycosyltransferase family 2 protein n=1 Tax=Gallaecimonas pentaromativorans TaxID=584787 RepID=UPI00067E9169|nr:glycosyltransferase family 2 protein [Gallaecimonas pentaromativorans]
MYMVSIVTATYNSSRYILEAYNSILSQSIDDWEWLITDDCSTDDTLDILVEISKGDSRVKVFSNSFNEGAAFSRNVSLKHSQGKFVAFLDSDDVWLPTKLEEQIEFMGEDLEFSFTAYKLIDENSNELEKTVDSTAEGSFSYEDMLKKKATLGCSTVILRRASFSDLEMPLIRTGQDYAFWLKLLKDGASAHILPCILTSYRISPNSISRNKLKKAFRQWRIYRDIEKLSLINSLNCFSYYAIRAIFRKK